ncbi:MAG: serine hydrolase [Roseitalea porphyridii]|uniref:serine hydrolase n=1 Tax=Roseitalea porphyridii TaxID=1852022 RepID=UPI0032D9589C
MSYAPQLLLSAMFAVLLLASGGAGHAQDTRIGLIRDIYAGRAEPNDTFAPSFLQQVPAAQVEAITRQMRTDFGPIEQISQTEGGFEILTRSHRLSVRISVDADGLVTGLRFFEPEARTASLAETVEAIAGLAEDVSVLVALDGERLHALRADDPLAVGSAFKLAVAKVLADRIAAGDLAMDDVVRLEDAHRSLPTGFLADFPDGAPVTIQTAASIMIGYSGNMATDLLMDVVGRDAVAEALGTEFVLTTREFFALKGDETLADRYLAADDAGIKAGIAAQAATGPLPEPADLPAHQPGIEWDVPATRLCELLAVEGLDEVFAVNRGPVAAGAWQDIRYKGGSETGVLNFSARMVAADGTEACAVVTLNDAEPIDLNRAVGLYTRLTRQLADEIGD